MAIASRIAPSTFRSTEETETQTMILAFLTSSKQLLRKLIEDRNTLLHKFEIKIASIRNQIEVVTTELQSTLKQLKAEKDVLLKANLVRKIEQLCSVANTVEELLNDLCETDIIQHRNLERRIFERQEFMEEFNYRKQLERNQLPDRLRTVQQKMSEDCQNNYNIAQEECLLRIKEKRQQLNELEYKYGFGLKISSSTIRLPQLTPNSRMTNVGELEQKYATEIQTLPTLVANDRLKLIKRIEMLTKVENEQMETLKQLDFRLKSLSGKVIDMQSYRDSKRKQQIKNERLTEALFQEDEKLKIRNAMLQKTMNSNLRRVSAYLDRVKK